METDELKKLWNQYDAKLEKSWSLNIKLIKEMNLQKTKNSVNNFTIRKGLSIAFQLIVIYFLMNFVFANYQNTGLAAQTVILLILTYAALIWNMYQFALIHMIKYNEPIVLIQKNIEKLKIQKLKYNKFIFIASYPYVMLMMFTILHISLLASNLPVLWLIPNIIIAICWFPFSFRIIKKYNMQDLKSVFWKKLSGESTLTPDSVSKALNNSLGFLSEIREFEKANG